MELDSAGKWIVALCFGAVMVAIYSWGRFDEPSYDSQSEHFARYKPRFSTSRGRFVRAKLGYVFAIVLVYFIFALVPEIFQAIPGIGSPGDKTKPVEGLLPLGVALGLITLQNAPVLKDMERRIRGFLHSFARIPERVRRTVAQMRVSAFAFDAAAFASQTRKLGVQVDGVTHQPATLIKLVGDDELLHGWYSIGCVLCALSERNRNRSGIDPIFFEYHKTELEDIAEQHVELAALVRPHFTEYLRANPLANSTVADGHNSAVFEKISDLRDRLYTFVACGVHFSGKDDAESLEIVTKLGFTVPPITGGRKSLAGPLAGLSFISLTILSIFTVYSTQVFRQHVLEPGAGERIDAFKVPAETLGLFLWSWTTAIFYFAAIFGALAIRSSRVTKREWFDITNLRRERPILNYIAPTLVGTALGCFTLTVVALIGGPGFNASVGEVGGAIASSLPWYPLATVMAFIAVMLSDSATKEGGFWRGTAGRAVLGAAAMAVAGFLTSQLSISTELGGQIPDRVRSTGVYLSLFTAAQIGLFAFVLCVIAQMAERYTARTQRFAGKYVDVATRQGRAFCIYFDESGEASLLAANQDDVSGHWQLFPEGTAVKWNTEAGQGPCKGGEFGLISSHFDSLIYEGYAGQPSGAADFVARAEVRTKASITLRRLREAALTGGALPRSDTLDSVEPAVGNSTSIGGAQS